MYIQARGLSDDVQFNSKTVFNDGDPVSSQLIFPNIRRVIDAWMACVR